MSALDSWLDQATRHLSRDSAAQVRNEIWEHYELAREAAIQGGATDDKAERLAVTALGDAKAANCQYRNVLLTSDEARMLREGNWEARALCSRPWLKWLLLALSLGVLLAGAVCLFTGAIVLACTLLTGGTAMGLLFSAPFLPIDTPSRGVAYRCVKWILLLATLGLFYGPDAFRWSWLLISCMWPVAWIEWKRRTIRRKLPVAQWPRHLYL